MRKGFEAGRRGKGLFVRGHIARALTETRVFFLRRLSAAQMAFCFVCIQNIPDASVQRWIDRSELHRYILMDRAFPDA